MNTSSPKHLTSNKDPKFENYKTNSENYNFNLSNTLQIVGLEQVENDVQPEQYYHQLFEIEKLGYIFKKEQTSTDGPEYDRVCPLCGQFVVQNSHYLVYFLKEFKRKFLSHYSCLVGRDSQRFKFIQISEDLDQAILRHQSYYTIRKQSIGISQSYYATLSISHPISNIIYLQLDKKINALNIDELQWTFGNQFAALYKPNFICLPYTDFKFTLTIDYQKFTKKYEFLVNLNRRQSKKKSQVSATTSTITLQMQVITSPEEKQTIVSQMNFIYPFSKNLALVKFNQVKIKIPEQIEDVETCTSEKKPHSEQFKSTASFSSHVLQNQNDNIYNPNQEIAYISRIHPQPVPMSQYLQIQQSPVHFSQQPIDIYYNDIDELIQSGKLKQYVETCNGSRQFQKYLKKCSLEQIQHILCISYEDLPEYIIHQYANYMFQGLIHVCSPQQRLKVINKIAPSLPLLSQNKKGTHSLQTLITVITTAQQAGLVCKALQKDLIMLAQNSNATHLIQKVIQTFDAVHLVNFYNQLLKEFVRLCKNSFGICVLKVFMKKVQNNNQIVNTIIDYINSNLEVIIQDPYGNYIVQHAYETFGENKCQKITSQIIDKFTQYCIQKFSANVVEKCITTYCKNLHQEAVDSIMEAGSLQQMLKTSTGNSILLKIVKAHPDKELEDSIKKVLSLPRMAKYSNNWDSHFYNFNQKAATCKNIKEESYNNFSEAAQMAKHGKTKKGSYTPKIRKF